MSRLSELLDRRACPLLNRHLVVSCRRSTVVLTPWSGADQRRLLVLRHRRDGPGAPTTPLCRDGRCRRDRHEVAPAVSSRATSLTTPAESRRRRRCRERTAESPSAAAAAAACSATVVACAAAVCVHVAVVCVCVSFLSVGDPRAVSLCIAYNYCCCCLYLVIILYQPFYLNRA